MSWHADSGLHSNTIEGRLYWQITTRIASFCALKTDGAITLPCGNWKTKARVTVPPRKSGNEPGPRCVQIEVSGQQAGHRIRSFLRCFSRGRTARGSGSCWSGPANGPLARRPTPLPLMSLLSTLRRSCCEPHHHAAPVPHVQDFTFQGLACLPIHLIS